MQPLPDERLLAIWETRAVRDADPGAGLLRAALPSNRVEELDDLPLACRRADLLELRCATFGPTLRAAMDCPQCSACLEFELDGRALLNRQTQALAAQEVGATSLAAVQARGLRFRLPTSRDLAAVGLIEDEHLAVVALVRRCCLESAAPETWPEELIAELDERFEAADPLGHVQLALQCPDCHRSWDQSFDIAHYFWEEIEVRAKTILVQVHRLARGYGWSEKEVLALTPARREAYLELLDA